MLIDSHNKFSVAHVRIWQTLPVHCPFVLRVHSHTPGSMQRPPFSHGGSQTAIKGERVNFMTKSAQIRV